MAKSDVAKERFFNLPVMVLISLSFMLGMSEFTALSSPQQEQLTEPFARIKSALSTHKSIAMIRDLRRRSNRSHVRS